MLPQALKQRLLISFACLILPLAVQATPQGLPHIQHWTLKNGAGIYFVNAPSLPMLDISVLVKAGTAYDKNQVGIANLTNNLLSEGAGQWNADQIARRFDSVGALYSNLVGRDFILLRLRSLTKLKWLNKATSTFGDIINTPVFPQAATARTKKQLITRIKRQQENPDDLASLNFFKALYPHHPYGQPKLGTLASLPTLSVGDMEQFYKTYYVGKNTQVILVGALSLEQAKTLSKHLVGNLPAGSKAPKINIAQPLKTATNVATPFTSEQTHLMLGNVAIARTSPDYFPLIVGNYILGSGGFSSRLMKAIRTDRGLTYSISSRFITLAANGPFVINLQTRNNKTQTALKVTRDVLTKFIGKGPTEKELIAAKKNLTGGFPLRLDSNSAISDELVNIAINHLPLTYLETYKNNIETVTLADIQAAFARTLAPSQLLTVKVGPVKPNA